MENLLNVEEVFELPKRQKNEDGYEYPEEFWNKLVKFGNDYCFITKTEISSVPAAFINEMIKTIGEPTSISEESIYNKIKKELYERVLKNMAEEIENAKAETTQCSLTIGEIGDAVNALNEKIEQLIGKQTTVESISISKLLALKEAFSADEIIKLKDGGVI